MKINDNFLSQYASNLKTPPTKQGWLYKRGELNTQYQCRWCTLRANMLFYSESKNHKPIGVIILEGSTVEFSTIDYNGRNSTPQSSDLYLFEIKWANSGPDCRIYTLGCEQQIEVDSWITALSISTCSYMRNVLTELKKQLNNLQHVPGTELKKPFNLAKRVPFEDIHSNLCLQISQFCPQLQCLVPQDKLLLNVIDN